jgi:hypothetical protein
MLAAIAGINSNQHTKTSEFDQKLQPCMKQQQAFHQEKDNNN